MALAYLALAWLLGIAAAAFTDGDWLAITAAAALLAAATLALRSRHHVAEVFQARRPQSDNDAEIPDNAPKPVGQGPRPDPGPGEFTSESSPLAHRSVRGAGGEGNLLRTLRTAILITLGLLAVLGAGVRYTSVSSPDVSLARLNGADIQLRAVIDADPDEGDTAMLYHLDVRQLSEDGGTTWHNDSGAILMRAPIAPRYDYGDEIEITGKLEEPPVFPDFNYRDYLLSRGIASIVSYPRTHVLDHDQASPITAATIGIRHRLDDALSDVLPQPHAALAAGILYGARSRIPDDLKTDMQTTGTSHLVAVSGQNVTIVAAFVIALLAWIIGRRPAAWLSLASIAGYTLLVGAQPSVIRAAIMGAVYVLSIVSGRQHTAPFALAITAAVMTALNPHVATDVSFQLSFAATLGLTTMSGPLRQRLEAMISAVGQGPRPDPHVAEVFQPRRTQPASPVGKGPTPDPGPGEFTSVSSRILAFPLTRPLTEGLAVTLSAIAFTLPITALNFGRISLIAPIANLFVVPAFLAVAATSGLAAAIDIAIPGASGIAAWIAYPPADYMVRATRLFASAPGASVTLHGINVWEAAAWYAALLAGAWWLTTHPAPAVEPPPLPAPSPRRHLMPVPGLALLAVLAIAVALLALNQPDRGRLSVTVMDVGQGDAILIEGPRGNRVLVDGGPGPQPIENALGRNLPFDDRRLDLVVLTHPQADHLAGLEAVLQDYDVRAVLDSPVANGTRAYKEWKAELQSAGVTVTTADRGQFIDLGDGATLDVLSPDADDPLLPTYDLNTDSTVLRLTMGDASFLLTGDLDAAGEANLIRAGADLHATVLKVGHHGSDTSSSPAFLTRVSPQIAAISVGAHNTFGHPTQTVLDRLSGDLVLRTDQQGDVHFETDGTQIWVDR